MRVLPRSSMPKNRKAELDERWRKFQTESAGMFGGWVIRLTNLAKHI
jgi:hypothetical protein